MDDAAPAAPRRVAPALLGAALALPAVAIMVVGARAQRPPWAGDGAWTTPLEVVLGLAALTLVAALVVVLRNLPGGLPRAAQPSTRSRWWLLVGAVAVGVLAWLSGVAARDPESTPAGGADLGLPPGLSGDGGAPLPASTTAVVAGLVALGLLAALATLVLRRQAAGATGHSRADARHPGPVSDAEPVGVPDGPPDDVVLAAWAVARHAVVAWLGAGEHEPPGGLLRRVAGTPAAAPLRTLTELYLPVRYGRARATAGDAAAARRALDTLRARLAGAGAQR